MPPWVVANLIASVLFGLLALFAYVAYGDLGSHGAKDTLLSGLFTLFVVSNYYHLSAVLKGQRVKLESMFAEHKAAGEP
jgi:hypothetical protein